MENKQILEKVNNIKKHSAAYQKIYGVSSFEPKDEIGGHIVYAKPEEKNLICPSDEFMTALFEECAAGLGFEYERR